MSSFDYFCYLAHDTAEFLAYFAIVTFPIALAAAGMVAWAWGRAGARRGRILTACAVPAIVPVCLLTIGVAFVRPERTAWKDGVHPPVPWFVEMTGNPAEYAMTAVLWLSLPLVGGLGWWSRRSWPAALASALWWGWVSMCASGMAEMSISGNWL